MKITIDICGRGSVIHNVYAINSVFSVVPETFEPVAGQRQVNFTWSPSLITRNNTVTTNYTLYCSPFTSSLPLSLTHAGSFIVTGFTPNTVYKCSLMASNELVCAPSLNITFTTKQDCKYKIRIFESMHIRLIFQQSPFSSCILRLQ